jgi:hypothetical protein
MMILVTVRRIVIIIPFQELCCVKLVMNSKLIISILQGGKLTLSWHCVEESVQFVGYTDFFS